MSDAGSFGQVNPSDDGSFGQVIEEYNPDELVPPASFASESSPEQSSTSSSSTSRDDIAKMDPADVAAMEGRRIYVAGFSFDCTEDEMRSYFEKFGEVEFVLLTRDKVTGRNRGFGFVTYKSPDSVQKVMSSQDLTLGGRRLEPQIAIPREKMLGTGRKHPKKIFVGGLSRDVTSDQLRAAFSSCGVVTDATVMNDFASGVSRGFGFVIFDKEEDAERVSKGREFEVCGKICEIRPAEPKENSRSFGGNAGSRSAARFDDDRRDSRSSRYESYFDSRRDLRFDDRFDSRRDSRYQDARHADARYADPRYDAAPPARFDARFDSRGAPPPARSDPRDYRSSSFTDPRDIRDSRGGARFDDPRYSDPRDRAAPPSRDSYRERDSYRAPADPYADRRGYELAGASTSSAAARPPPTASAAASSYEDYYRQYAQMLNAYAANASTNPSSAPSSVPSAQSSASSAAYYGGYGTAAPSSGYGPVPASGSYAPTPVYPAIPSAAPTSTYAAAAPPSYNYSGYAGYGGAAAVGKPTANPYSR